ncbi:MAG: MBOAT family protein [Bacteroidales bacterium]|nr:MBOAT family protein [Candidatus Colimorpha pelethequi]
MFLHYLKQLFAFDSSHPLLFTQFDFWAFFFIVFAVFCLIVGRQKGPFTKGHRLLRNTYLFLVSVLFYYKTSGWFVLLLFFSTLSGWIIGILLDKEQSESRRKAKIWMALGVIINLAVLFFFKYAYFFTDIFNTITNSHYSIAIKIILPVGISFFTFQNISYIVDVYKRKITHVENVLDFAFYTTFFPQLVAGPIIRADQFVPQLYKPFFLSRRQFGIAVFWILNGLLKKIILSDYLAVSFIDRVFDNPLLYTPFENCAALFVYSLQVYADFSGYTDIAIGVAMLMGFYLPKNFNSPYKATNPAGFWKRWHISLSNWLKDYLYIPLGGNRSASWPSYVILGGILIIIALMAKNLYATLVVSAVITLLIAVYILFPKHRKEFNTNVNNMDTMLLGGLWHGASFNFITWGGLNGLGILIYKWWKKIAPAGRIIAVTLTAGLTWVLHIVMPCPLLNMLNFTTIVIFIAYTLLNITQLIVQHWKQDFNIQKTSASIIWNTLLTFTFISFTRLFFRSGSNLDPAEANEVAWRTASQMVNQIGSSWNLQQIPQIVSHYSAVFILFAIGMIIHWLPEHFKRRYRLWFAQMPATFLVIISLIAIFIMRQFVTADVQPFIYFQF